MPAADFVDATDLAKFKAADQDAIVDQVQGSIRTYCGWHVAGLFTDHEVILDGRGSTAIWLPSLKVTAVTEVINEGVTLTADDYDWSADGYLELRNGYCWSRRPRQVSVKFTHGFDPVPEDLIGVAVGVAARAVASPSGATREQVGSVALGYGTFNGVSGGIALLEHEKEQLDQFRLPPRP